MPDQPTPDAEPMIKLSIEHDPPMVVLTAATRPDLPTVALTFSPQLAGEVGRGMLAASSVAIEIREHRAAGRN
jgi:hypothetical protein